jgi:hypothetical protein
MKLPAVVFATMRWLSASISVICGQIAMVRSGFAYSYAVTGGIRDGSICADLRYLRYFMRWSDPPSPTATP